MHKKTVVIFGISSFMGSNLADVLKKDFRVIGTYDKCRTVIPGVLTLSCDVLNRHAVQTVLYTFKPDVTIYCVGLSSLIDCNENEKLADALNTAGLFNVTTFTERYRSKFCYISSSFVFPGINSIYSESETPMSNTVYGNTLASSEFYIQKSCLNYMILRTCPLYGRSYNPMQLTFFEALEKNFFLNKNIVCDDRIHHGYMDVCYFGSILKRCIDLNVTNRLIQVSTSNVVTRLEFAKTYARIFNQSEGLISRSNWPFPFDNRNVASYKTDGDLFYRMSVNNLEDLMKAKAPSVEESLQYTLKRFDKVSGSKKSVKKSTGISFI